MFKRALITTSAATAVLASLIGVASAGTTCRLQYVYSPTRGYHQELVCYTTTPGCRIGYPC